MKLGFKKMICAAVFFAMIISALPSVSYAKASGGSVLFSYDFESDSEGSIPQVLPGEAGKWTKAVCSELAYVKVYKENDKNQVGRFYNEPSNEKLGYPTLRKDIDATELDDVTLSFRAMSSSKARIIINTDSQQNVAIQLDASASWTEYEVTVYPKKGTYSVKAGGKVQTEETKLENTIYDVRSLAFQIQYRISGGAEALIDDVKITTTKADADIARANNGTEGVAVETAISREIASAAVGAAKGITGEKKSTVFIYDDAESGKEGEKITKENSSWTKISAAASSYFSYGVLDGHKVIVANNTDVSAHYPTLNIRPEASEISTLRIEADIIGSASSSLINIASDNSLTTNLVNISTSKSWQHIIIDADLKAKTYTASVDGATTDGALHDISDMKSVSINFQSKVASGDKVYWDNLLVSSGEAVSVKKVLNDDGSVNFENVEVKTDDLMVSHLRAHPRLYVTDWNEIKNKIDTDPMCARWYENVVSSADTYLTQPMVDWQNLVKGYTNLTEARELVSKAFVYGMVFNISGDIRYRDALVSELLSAASVSDWTTSSFLGNAELNHAFSIAYDWLYYDLTDAEKQQIMDGWKRGGIGEYIKNYEGNVTNINFMYVDYNWNHVCNGAAVITGLAIADEYPQIGEYLIVKGTANIKKALNVFNPDGGFPEGVGYWHYAIRYTTYAMDCLDGAFAEGYTLPGEYQYWNYPGMKEAMDFAIYMNSNAGSFNYGDSGTGRTNNFTEGFWWADTYNSPEYGWFQMKFQRELGVMTGQNAALALIRYNTDGYSYDPIDFPLDRSYNQKNFAAFEMRSSWESKNALFFAMQAGKATTNHMAYSVGTFMIESDGVVWATMRGYGISSNAAENYGGRAEGQNCVVINPDKEPGQAYRVLSPITDFKTEESGAYGIVDMTPQYADDVTKYLRGAMMTEDRTRVLLQDEIEAKAPSDVWWFMHTSADIKLSPDAKSAILTQNGKQLWVNIYNAPSDAKFIIMDSKPLPSSPMSTLQTNYGSKLAIHAQNVTSAVIGVEFKPLASGEGIPSSSAYAPLSEWTLTKKEQSIKSKMSTSTALMLQSPVAFAKGERTYVDPDNMDVCAIEQSGRTLVPVRFISESFGAAVGWNEATNEVSVVLDGNKIALTLGSDKMYVNGIEKTLDVTAQTINNRTMIPLRALVEALGKEVIWDDRGLIIINDFAGKTFSESDKTEIIDMLTSRVTIGGREMTWFDSDKSEFNVMKNADGTIPEICDQYGNKAIVNKDTASLTINGKNYVFNFTDDKFASAVYDSKNTSLPSVINVKNDISADGKAASRIKVKDVTMYGGESYGKFNTVDMDLSSRWSAKEDGAFLCYDFGETKNIYSMSIATLNNGGTRSFTISILSSNDGVNFSEVKKIETTAQDDMPEIIEIGNISARYIKLVGGGNTANTWNSWTEVAFYENEQMQKDDAESWSTIFNAGGITGKAGEKFTLAVTGTDIKNLPVAIPENAQIEYSSTDNSICTADKNGTVTITGKGNARVMVYVYMEGGRIIRIGSIDILAI